MDALVVIDVQQGMFLVPDAKPHEGEAVVARIRGLLDRAREAGTAVFFVQHDGGPGDILDSAGPGFPFRPELTPQPDERVTVKRHCNAFQATDLEAALKTAGVDHLIVCGMQSDYCVDTATRAAVERGFRVTLVGDAHTTFDSAVLKAPDIVAHHNTTLNGSFAAIVPAAEIAFSPA